MSSESDAVPKKNGDKNLQSNLPLKSLGIYTIERKLGQGGMGTVYLATHTKLKKLVALKVLPRDKAKNPVLVRRFQAEAQAAGQLEHPNIVAVYDTGDADGYLFIAMEYVEGIDLFEQIKRRGAIPVKRSIEIIKQVAAALQHAFEHSIVHRDIKPSNLLLKHDGTVKVTDLGLARSIDDTLETNITRAGTTVGTVDYMSPEQARNSKSADIRSDLYSLGCTWYQMLTGQPPYPEGSVTNKLQAHAVKPLPDPRELNENIPEGLIAILQRMTAKKPEDRYQTPAELLHDLTNSKLTRAAFSNEIFSDLSDYDMDAVQKFHHAADEGDAEDSDEFSDESLEQRPVRKTRPSDLQDEVAPSQAKRSQKVSRSRVERTEEDADEFDVTPTRKKPSSNPVGLNPASPEKPNQPRSKTSSRSQDDDDTHDDRHQKTDHRGRSRNNSADDEDDEESPAQVASKHAKNRSTPPQENQESRPKNPKGRKNASSQEAASQGTEEKNSGKFTPKALPPKRLPTSDQVERQSPFSLDSLKSLGMVAAAAGIIGWLGWLVFAWSFQVDSGKKPLVQVLETSPTPVVVAPPPRKSELPEANESNPSITETEPVKTGDPDPSKPKFEYDISKEPVPSWASAQGSEPADLPKFSVGPGIPSATHFAVLNEALHAAEKAGGFVKLIGNGPFLLSQVELSNAKQIVIAAATPQDQPLIIFTAAEPGSPIGLVVNKGQLDLRGLHFVVDRSAQSHLTSSSLISVIDGQLSLRKCSFSATGNSPSATVAVSFSSQQDSQTVPVISPEVLLDHVVVRGDGITALKIDRSIVDAVIQDSLLVTGSAPAIDLSGNLNQGFGEITEAKPRRTIRILRSTLSGRKQILEFAAPNGGKPPTTAIFFQDSVCAAEGTGSNVVLLSAVRWPSISSTTTGWLTNLSWTSQFSFYLGFERLIDLDRSSFKVENPKDWQRVWGKKIDPAQIQSFVWKESLSADLSTVMPYDYDNSKLALQDFSATRGKISGCNISQLSVPDFISQSRLNAIGLRPKLPAIVVSPANSLIVRKVNLLKEDLGLILNKNDWQSGTLFEATGVGPVQMSPARIAGKSLRIVFYQGDGPPLKIQPKALDMKGKQENPGLFSIESGTLDLESAVIESSSVSKNVTVSWLIHAKNASLILRGCQLSGPILQDLEHHQGLIHWVKPPVNQTSPPVEIPFLSMSDSLLMSTGVGIRFESALGNLFVRNSIIAVRGYGLDLRPISMGTSLQPMIDLQHVTFSASKAAIRVEATTGTDPIVTPMRMFVENCAVTTPLEFKAGESAESTVVECAGSEMDLKLIEWWGVSNGFSKELKSLLRQPEKEPISTPSDWKGIWGEANDIRLLVGLKGVQLTNNNRLPNKWINLKVSSFLLDPLSAGATWAEGGQPVGADISGLEELSLAKKGSGANKGGPGQSTKGGIPKPFGKNNDPGF